MNEVTQRIYRDSQGRATLDRDKAQSMLYPEGTLLTAAQAAALPKDVAAKAVKQPPNDKALKSAPNTKQV